MGGGRLFYILSNCFTHWSKILPTWREKFSSLNAYEVEHSRLYKKTVEPVHWNACEVVISVTLALEAFWLRLVAAKPRPAVLSGAKIFHVVFLAELLYANCTWSCKLQRKELLEEEMWVILIFFYHLIVLSWVHVSDIFIIFLSWVLLLRIGKNAKFTMSFSSGGVFGFVLFFFSRLFTLNSYLA